MDKIGGIRSFQATGANQTEKTNAKQDTSATIDDSTKSLDDVLFTTQDGTEITRGDLKHYLALKMAVDFTQQIGSAVNQALASIKSGGDDSDSSSSSTSSSSSKSISTLLSAFLKKDLLGSGGDAIKDRLDNMLHIADNLHPSDPEAKQAQLMQIGDANAENQKDLSAYITQKLEQSNTADLKQSTESLNALIKPIQDILP